MTLYIDIGNSRIKFWLVGEDGLLARFSHADEQALLTWLQQQGAIKHVTLASVRSKETTERLLQLFSMPLQLVEIVSYNETLLTSAYSNPHLLGIDRWLATLAAKTIRQHAYPAIIVDAGTAITIDVLSADGDHIGGYIVPGLAMQVQSLGQHTHKVRVDNPQWSAVGIGKNTQDCVSHGALAAIVALIKQTKQALEAEAGLPVVMYLTGGDAPLIKPFIAEAKHVEELVLLGLMAATKCTINQELIR